MGAAGAEVVSADHANWVLRTAEDHLLPVYEELHQQLVKREVLHVDETTFQVLHEPGKKAQAKSYMWLYRTGREDGLPIVLYEYQPSRKAKHAEKFLKGLSGYLHADGYQGYHKLPGNIRVVGCWAHAGGSSTRRSVPCRQTSGRARRRLLGWNTATSCSLGRSGSRTAPQRNGQNSVWRRKSRF